MTASAAAPSTDFAGPTDGQAVLTLVLVGMVAALFVASVAIGSTGIVLFSGLDGIFADEPSAASVILREIRLPRAILGLMAGATLGMAGAALQGLLRNPLAAPGVMGVSASAGLGAVIVFYFGLSQVFSFALPLGGMAGALLAVGIIYLLAGRDSSVLTLILAGAAINAFAAALTSLALNLAPSPFAALEIVFWLLGSLTDRSFEHVATAGPVMIAGWLLMLGVGRPLDALTLGEDTARSLGVNLGALRLRVILGTALSVGAVVSVTGGIGFVGLVVPHLLRPFVRHRPGRLLWVSALGGAALVLAADIVVRLIHIGPGLKLGVVTALVGAPFFLYLILKTRRDML
jgi:iron complex transport system permease protein